MVVVVGNTEVVETYEVVDNMEIVTVYPFTHGGLHTNVHRPLLVATMIYRPTTKSEQPVGILCRQLGNWCSSLKTASPDSGSFLNEIEGSGTKTKRFLLTLVFHITQGTFNSDEL